jgi:hypothetical protein
VLPDFGGFQSPIAGRQAEAMYAREDIVFLAAG